MAKEQEKRKEGERKEEISLGAKARGGYEGGRKGREEESMKGKRGGIWS